MVFLPGSKYLDSYQRSNRSNLCTGGLANDDLLSFGRDYGRNEYSLRYSNYNGIPRGCQRVHYSGYAKYQLFHYTGFADGHCGDRW